MFLTSPFIDQALSKCAPFVAGQPGGSLPIGTLESSLPADFLSASGGAAQRAIPDRAFSAGAKAGRIFLRARAEHPGALEGGGFRAEARHLGLDQELPADAGVDIFF